MKILAVNIPHRADRLTANCPKCGVWSGKARLVQYCNRCECKVKLVKPWPWKAPGPRYCVAYRGFAPSWRRVDEWYRKARR